MSAMKSIILSALFLALHFYSVFAVGAEVAASNESRETQQYMRVDIDCVVIDTDGLTIASDKLAHSIDQLARSIRQLAAKSANLSAQEKETLLHAVASVDQTGVALAQLARQLPRTAQNLSTQLPQVVENARQPIAELSSGLASARDGIYAITESLPQATANAKQLVNSTLDAALIRLTTYSIILVALLALALVGVMWFVYRQYLDPLARKLDSLVGAPEHFAAMSLHMKETSENLLALQSTSAVPPKLPESLPGAPQTESLATEPHAEQPPAAQKPD